jgi:hypothetical protein
VEAILGRLVAAGIELYPALELTTHFVFLRGEYVALVERRGEAFGNIGAPGLLCEGGMAQLVWRGENAYFVARGFERAATGEEVAALRQFGQDLKDCLQAD